MKTLFVSFALLAGPVWAAPDVPLGLGETARLNAQIERFYAGRSDADRRAPFTADFAGLPVAAIALGHVARHMKDPGEAAVDRAVEMLDWVHALVVSAWAGAPQPFLGLQIKRHLSTLFEHFKDRPRVIDQVALLIDATSAWSSEHLPVLAKHAGRTAPAEALYFAHLAQGFESWEPEAARRMVEVIRAVRLAQRTPEQWGLLGLSGHASQTEAAQILLMAAHAYANRDVTAAIFAAEHPLRAALEFLSNEYQNDSAFVQNALLEALDLSKKEAGRVSPRDERLWFFKAFGNNVLLDPTNPAVTYDGSISAAAAASRAVNAPAPAPEPLKRDGNVVYPKFGCGRALEKP